MLFFSIAEDFKTAHATNLFAKGLHSRFREVIQLQQRRNWMAKKYSLANS